MPAIDCHDYLIAEAEGEAQAIAKKNDAFCSMAWPCLFNLFISDRLFIAVLAFFGDFAIGFECLNGFDIKSVT